MYDTVLTPLNLASSLKYFSISSLVNLVPVASKLHSLSVFFLYAFLKSFSSLVLRFEVSLWPFSSMPLLKSGLPTIFFRAVLSLGTKLNGGIVVEESTPRGNAAVGALFLQVNVLYNFVFNGKHNVITLLKSDRRTRLASLKQLRNQYPSSCCLNVCTFDKQN